MAAGRKRNQKATKTGRASTGPASGPASGASAGRDWATDLMDRLEEVIDKVRAQTTDRLLRIVRTVVFGLVAVIMALMAVILLIIATVRAFDRLIPQEVWLTYLVIGGLFTGAGLFLWSKKQGRPTS